MEIKLDPPPLAPAVSFLGSWILKKTTSSVLPPSIKSLVITIDQQPTFRGDESSSAGTELAGCVEINLRERILDCKKIIVVIQGIKRVVSEAAPNFGPSTSSEDVSNSRDSLAPVIDSEDYYHEIKEIWNGTNGLKIGISKFRYSFKLPGHLPSSVKGVVEYIVKAKVITAENTFVAVEDVLVTREEADSPDGSHFEPPPAWRPKTPPPPPYEI